MNQHTPGPWRDDGLTGDTIIIHSQWGEVARVAWNSQHSANARLIASAPELLEACQAAKLFLQPDLIEPGRTVFWKLVAAISKAQGGAQ